MPDENPSGLGAFDLPLRLPGQYFDKETNLHYNYFRDYDPSIGRYVESDPIGLEGGLNTYVYVRSNPLALIDLKGLQAETENYGPCYYYTQGYQRSGCRYYALAAQVCRGQLTATNVLQNICAMSVAQKNCVRKCLVEEDQQALNDPACRETCSTGKCPNLDCVDRYHAKCFTQCGVTGGTACYGGTYIPLSITLRLYGTQ